jgi:hypothetical protein
VIQHRPSSLRMRRIPRVDSVVAVAVYRSTEDQTEGIPCTTILIRSKLNWCSKKILTNL